MKKTIIIIELFVFSSLLACNVNADKNFDNQQKKIASSQSSEIVADFTKTFQGTINNKYEITMTLTKKSTVITGSYKYKTQTNSLNLKGTIDANGNLNVNEFNDKGSITGVFKGKIANSNISGTWEKPDGSKSFAFNVSEAQKVSAGNTNSSAELVWVGNYLDKFGRVLKITAKSPKQGGEVKFELDMVNENCQEIFEGTANTTSPTVAYYRDETGCSVKLTLNDDGSIDITESNCLHGARCGGTEGNYKRKK